MEKVNRWRKENDTWCRGGEAIPLSVSFFPSSHPIASQPPISFYFFLFLFCIFSSDTRHPCSTFTIRTWMGTRMRKRVLPVDPHGIVTIVIYISSLFILMTTSPRLGKRRNEEQSMIERIELFASYTLDHLDITWSFQRERSEATLPYLHHIRGLSLWYIKSQSKRCNITKRKITSIIYIFHVHEQIKSYNFIRLIYNFYDLIYNFFGLSIYVSWRFKWTTVFEAIL